MTICHAQKPGSESGLQPMGQSPPASQAVVPRVLEPVALLALAANPAVPHMVAGADGLSQIWERPRDSTASATTSKEGPPYEPPQASWMLRIFRLAWHKGWSLRARLTAWVLLLLLVRALMIVAAIYWAFTVAAYEHLDAHVEEEIIELATAARQIDPQAAWGQILSTECRPDRRKFFSVRILDPQGRQILATGAFLRGAWQDYEFPALDRPQTLNDLPDDPEHDDDNASDRWRLYYAVLTDSRGDRYTMHLAVDLTYMLRYSELFHSTIVVVSIVAAVLGIVVANWIIRRSLRPLSHLTARMRSVGVRSLDERLDVPHSHDEVADMVCTFNAMLDRIQQSVQRLRHFTADAAHELRTPLAAAFTATQVALRQPRSAEEYRATLAALVPALEQLSALGRDMALLAESEAEGLHLAVQPTDLYSLVTDMVELLAPLAEERQLALTLLPPPDHPVIAEVDAARIRQVVFNLIENAIKYTRQGHVVVAVRQGPAFPNAASGSPSGSATAVVQVADSGPGIAAEHFARLFDRFYRLERDRNRRTGGSGLGLAICRSLVTAHAGTLAVASQLGIGTVFTIELPMPSATSRNSAQTATVS